MSTCLSSASKTTTARDSRYVRILKWTFRRGGETMICELGLTSDNSAYELRIDPPANPAGSTTEMFDDAMTAFQRHARIERILVQEGWSLDTFESQQLPRRA